MFSLRFNREVQITDHARERMVERSVDENRLHDLIETGETKYKDDVRLWIYKSYDDRDDNLICVAAVVEWALVIKTIMHHFEIT